MSGRPHDAFQLAERAIDTVLKIILTLLALFYMLLDGPRFGRAALRFVPPNQREHVAEVAEQIHLVLGRYLRGQLFLIGLMSIVTTLMLTFVFKLPYALPLGIATGILEVIPLLGPWLAGGLAPIVALVHGGPGLAIGVGVAFFVLRMAEDQLVMPFVVGRAVHLHPLVTIFSVLLGGSLAGVLGAVLAVPVAAAIRVTLDYAFPIDPGAPLAHQDRLVAPPPPDGPPTAPAPVGPAGRVLES
jgi:predicted PurR-regulated permease PerM